MVDLVGKLNKRPAKTDALDVTLQQGLAARIAKDGQKKVAEELQGASDNFAKFHDTVFERYAKANLEVPDEIIQDFADYEELASQEALFNSVDKSIAAQVLPALPLGEIRNLKDTIRNRIKRESFLIRTEDEILDLENKRLENIKLGSDIQGVNARTAETLIGNEVGKLELLEKREARKLDDLAGGLSTKDFGEYIESDEFARSGISYSTARKLYLERKKLDADVLGKELDNQGKLIQNKSASLNLQEQQRAELLGTLGQSDFRKFESQINEQGIIRIPDVGVFTRADFAAENEKRKKQPLQQQANALLNLQVRAEQQLLDMEINDVAIMQGIISGSSVEEFRKTETDANNAALEISKITAMLSTEDPITAVALAAPENKKFLAERRKSKITEKTNLFKQADESQKALFLALKSRKGVERRHGINLLAERPTYVGLINEQSPYAGVGKIIQEVILPEFGAESKAESIDNRQNLAAQIVAAQSGKKTSKQKITSEQRQARLAARLEDREVRKRIVSEFSGQIEQQQIAKAFTSAADIFNHPNSEPFKNFLQNNFTNPTNRARLNPRYLTHDADTAAVSEINWNAIQNDLINFANESAGNEAPVITPQLESFMSVFSKSLLNPTNLADTVASIKPQTVEEAVVAGFVTDFEGQTLDQFANFYIQEDYKRFQQSWQTVVENSSNDVAEIERITTLTDNILGENRAGGTRSSDYIAALSLLKQKQRLTIEGRKNTIEQQRQENQRLRD